MKRYLTPAIVSPLCLALLTPLACGDQVTYEEQDGVTYRVVKRIEQRPVSTDQWKEHTETVYKEQYVTQTQDSYRTVFTPVTEYRCEPRWHNWWNPLSRPHVAYHLKPVTRWATRTEVVQSPVTYRQVVPETRVVRVPSRSLRFEDREIIVSRVPVTSSQQLAAPIAPRLAPGRPVGGISRLDNDPPRTGTSADERVRIR